MLCCGAEYTTEGHAFVAEALADEAQRVLVHCEAGISRSVTVVRLRMAACLRFVVAAAAVLECGGVAWLAVVDLWRVYADGEDKGILVTGSREVVIGQICCRFLRT